MMDAYLAKMCRICLKEGNDFKSIFHDDEVRRKDVSVSNKIMACSSVQVVAGDGLPELICSECLAQVDVAYDFRERCQSADAALRKYISISKPYFDNEYNDTVPAKIDETESCSNGVNPFTCVQTELVTPTTKDKTKGHESDSDVPLSAIQRKKKNDEKPKRVTPKKCEEENEEKKRRGKDEKDIKCPVCKKTFAYLCILKDHMVQHTGAKPYLCSSCGKSFGHTASLTNHMKTHYSDKPHKCNICELSFHRRSHLVLHIRTHTGEKPFVCDVCGRDFAQNSYLKEHMRVHSGEKPFICDICGHRFARKSCLIMHRRVHTGELPYPCPECGRAFSQRSQRKRHVKRNHKGSACLRATGELILKDLDLKNKNPKPEEPPNETLNENSLPENTLSLPQDRMMQQQQQQQQQLQQQIDQLDYQQPPVCQVNNPPLIIYQQDSVPTLYPTTIMPLPLIQLQTTYLQ